MVAGVIILLIFLLLQLPLVLFPGVREEGQRCSVHRGITGPQGLRLWDRHFTPVPAGTLVPLAGEATLGAGAGAGAGWEGWGGTSWEGGMKGGVKVVDTMVGGQAGAIWEGL